MSEPSWWQYMGGRDADRTRVTMFAALLRDGVQLPEQDLNFYIAAMERLAADRYEPVAHRPPDVRYFWLSCHYWLGTLTQTHKAAALATGALVSIDHKTIQRHANDLVRPVREFLAAIVALPEFPTNPADAPRVHTRMMEWFAEQVQKVG